MTAATAFTYESQLTEQQKSLLIAAGVRIAPTWPLDQMIAVNPFWEMRDEPIERVAARLSTLTGARLLMPKEYYLGLYKSGDISRASLLQAATEQKVTKSVQELENELEHSTNVPQWHNLSDLLDSDRDPHTIAWRDEITHQISQFCAAHYQKLHPMLRSGNIKGRPDLYRHWLEVTRRDQGISIILDEPGFHEYFQQLPGDAETLLAQCITSLTLADEELEPYAHALLLDINGWASWVAYLRWQGNLHDKPHDDMLQLLAIRMAWELTIWRFMQAKHPKSFERLGTLWVREKDQLPHLLIQAEDTNKPMWVWAKAAEFSYQHRLNKQLLAAQQQTIAKPKLQAAFCIDVRSEVMRRALESQSEHIQTFGFAGFFGLPLEYQPADTQLSRPQLPGLLKPAIRATETRRTDDKAASLNQTARWQSWTQAAPSSFSMVESMGWLYAFKMLKKAFFARSDENPMSHLSHQQHWTLKNGDQELTVSDKAELAKGILNTMGLRDFAPTVLLVGHGSHTTNNLHAAGLDCGACGGQTGEVNVRVLAQLLNDKDVRAALIGLGVTILDTTRFVAALHITTTDHISCFDEPVSETVTNWLLAATRGSQRERIALIDPTLAAATDAALDKAYIKRSNDWSQVRPEWGLANNAAFIVAPRAWTRQVDLKGRSFLHDYQWQNDDGFAVLELIMTAPMIVTNWINMQYNASVTDNLKYGSGNKVLHNAVGGHIGLYEGNGGDLRIGLAMQSLHNGEKWMHQPQRLSVYIAAPKEPIERIAAQHDSVRQLIDNEWLYLLRWTDDGEIERFYQQQWWPVAEPEA